MLGMINGRKELRALSLGSGGLGLSLVLPLVGCGNLCNLSEPRLDHLGNGMEGSSHPRAGRNEDAVRGKALCTVSARGRGRQNGRNWS